MHFSEYGTMHYATPDSGVLEYSKYALPVDMRIRNPYRYSLLASI